MMQVIGNTPVLEAADKLIE
jgi:hypothetical protein